MLDSLIIMADQLHYYNTSSTGRNSK